MANRNYTFEAEETSSGMMYSVYDPNGNRLTEPYISEGFARLIAAAPDMFEALRDLLAPHFDEDGILDPKSASTIVGRNSRDELVLKGSFMTLLERARAALSRASALSRDMDR